MSILMLVSLEVEAASVDRGDTHGSMGVNIPEDDIEMTIFAEFQFRLAGQLRHNHVIHESSPLPCPLVLT